MIVFVSFAEFRGGAAKSAYKFYRACKKRDIEASYLVVEKNSSAIDVMSPSKLAYALHFLKRLTAYCLQWLQRDGGLTKHSLNIFSCAFVVKRLKESRSVHLHWINNETISLEQLARINGRLVITLHDEWFYCGSEHLAMDSVRPVEGYLSANKNVKWLDWDRITWERKRTALRAIKDRVIFTAPSTWIVNRAQNSSLLSDFKVRLVPNLVDTEVFSRNTDFGSLVLGNNIQPQDTVILFGAVHGKNMQLKGFQVLHEALLLLANKLSDRNNIVIVTFGGELGANRKDMGFKHVEVGPVADAVQLAQLYSRACFTVVPSLVESFGQVAAESLSCETPVVAFRCSGLTDIVLHMTSGFLATPYLAESLCDGMHYLLGMGKDDLRNMGQNGRRHIVDNFVESAVMEKLFAVYKEHGIDY
jgi:glycosyltransferase involved in cell wall biosynthesis